MGPASFIAMHAPSGKERAFFFCHASLLPALATPLPVSNCTGATAWGLASFSIWDYCAAQPMQIARPVVINRSP
jgi:hypothetical protein